MHNHVSMERLKDRLRGTRVWASLATARYKLAKRRRRAGARLALRLFYRRKGAPATVIRHGTTSEPWIALTFDDNYDTDRSLATLDILSRNGVPASIFVTGQWVNEYPEVTQRIAAGPFEIGDHSLSHPDLRQLSLKRVLAEIGGGVGAFEALMGVSTAPLFRPPGGYLNEKVAAVAGVKGFPYMVLWDIDPKDWAGVPADTIEDCVVRGAHNGAIVLLHLSAPHTCEALPNIIASLRERGYEFVTVTEMIRAGCQGS